LVARLVPFVRGGVDAATGGDICVIAAVVFALLLGTRAETEDAERVLFVFVARSPAFNALSVFRASRSWEGAREERSWARFLFDDAIRKGSFCTGGFFLEVFSFMEAKEECSDGSLGGGGGGELLLLGRD
jgi:hypothetical protein